MFHFQALYNIAILIFTWFNLANAWLTFEVVIDLVAEQHPLFGAATDDINVIIKYIYVGLVVLQFILALGNRPKGSKWSYIFSFVVFGLIQLYTLVCAMFLVVLAFSNPTVIVASGTLDFIRKFLTSTNGIILIALAATFGVYLVASILYLDPWHMITSFPQYSLMMTSYINILNVYAFCNWHDVSWGTKGSDKADSLPSAQTTKKSDDEGGASVEIVEYEVPQVELDSKFEKVVKRALAPYKEPEKNESRSMDDAYKSFRTKLIIAWIFSNMVLVLAISSSSLSGHFGFNTDSQVDTQGFETDVQKREHIYFSLILWATAILALIRFSGCMFYLFKLGLLFCCRRK